MTEPGRARPSGMWLAGAVIAALVAGGVTIADKALAKSDREAATRALDGDAERIASALDATARAAHLRADSLATAPVLRAAIETDAATFTDLAASENVFRAATGEVIEVFQLRGDAPHSVMRVPAGTAGLTPVTGAEVRIETDGASIAVVAGAPISAQSGTVKGSVAVATAVDLAVIQHYLAPHATSATIEGLAAPIPLLAAAGTSSGVGVRVPIVAAGLGSATPLTLVATPVATAGVVAWADPVRYAALGLAALLLIVYAIGLGRSRSRP